ATLATELQQRIGPFGYRVCVDTAPVLEKALARDAGLGWIGKHTNLIARERGSWFFLGEILTDLPLPVDERAGAHCGSCQACIPQRCRSRFAGARRSSRSACVARPSTASATSAGRAVSRWRSVTPRPRRM